MNRLRIVGWNVQPIAMIDDGENLTALPINPQLIPNTLWQEFKDGGDDKMLDSIRMQILDPVKTV